MTYEEQAKVNKKVVRKVQKLCRKFHDDLQRIYDNEMDYETYENSPAVHMSVIAQSYASDSISAEIN